MIILKPQGTGHSWCSFNEEEQVHVLVPGSIEVQAPVTLPHLSIGGKALDFWESLKRNPQIHQV